MPAARPSTVQVLAAPIWVPASGVAQVPEATEDAEPQEITGESKRTSYLAGLPVPSLTSVKDRVTLLEPVLDTLRLETAPGGGRGAALERVTVIPAEVFMFPAVSRAVAVRVCEPLG